MKLMEVREVKPNNNLKIKNMTAVDYLFESLYLFETLWNNPRDEKTKKTWNSILERSKKLEKQQMMDCYLKANLFQRKHEFEQYYDENYVCKGVKGMASSQTEISDEEIEKASIIHCGERNSGSIAFEDGARWYREQLKSKGNGNK